MILARQFPSLWGNRSLLADLHALLLHGLSEHEIMENMYRQVTTNFLSLDKNQNGIILHFLQELLS